jgi:hypothetical protein
VEVYEREIEAARGDRWVKKGWERGWWWNVESAVDSK